MITIEKPTVILSSYAGDLCGKIRTRKPGKVINLPRCNKTLTADIKQDNGVPCRLTVTLDNCVLFDSPITLETMTSKFCVDILTSIYKKTITDKTFDDDTTVDLFRTLAKRYRIDFYYF